MVAFVQAAREFVHLTKASTVKGAEYPTELYRAVLTLANATFARVLSDLGPPLGDEEIDELGVDVDLEEWKAVFDSTNATIYDTYYDFVWPDGDKTMGCIADDVADIYGDIKPALDAWDMQKDEYLADIIWTWKQNYTGHWKWHLDGLLGALPAIVRTNGWNGIPLMSGEKNFFDEIIARHPEWRGFASRRSRASNYTWFTCAEIPSPTGDSSRQLCLWIENGDLTIAFASNWHTHAATMADFREVVDAILEDKLVITMDVGGDSDGFETVIDLRVRDNLLNHITSEFGASRTQIKSFRGTADCEKP